MSCSPCEKSAVVHTVLLKTAWQVVVGTVEEGMTGDVDDGMDPTEHGIGTSRSDSMRCKVE